VLYIVHFTAFCLGGPFFPVTVYVGPIILNVAGDTRGVMISCDPKG